MKLGYSEFSYGYAFTENLVRASSTTPVGAPRFPNLIEEGKLGYDLRIDLPALPLFFQFKLPQLMVRSRASEIAKTGGALQVPFFRMPIMRRDVSDQHAILVGLERRYPGAVFFAAPRMASVGDFNVGYNNLATQIRSVLISPNDIGALPDDRKHTVSYNLTGHIGWFCSEPKELSLKDYSELVRETTNRLGDEGFTPLREFAPRLVKALQSIRPEPPDSANTQTGLATSTFGEGMGAGVPAILPDEKIIRERFRSLPRATVDQPSDRGEQEVAEDLYVAREIARISLGVQLMIAQPTSK